MNQTISQLQSIVPDLLSVMKNTDSSDRIPNVCSKPRTQSLLFVTTEWAKDMDRLKDIERFLKEV